MILSFVFAEYRAYEHKIINTTDNSERIVTSILDPDQYPGYFPLEKSEVLVMNKTWMCYGNTGNVEKICQNPRPENQSPTDTRAPASP